MKRKTSELTGAALDWAVAKCENPAAPTEDLIYHVKCDKPLAYSTDWAQGGPIIDHEGIGFYRANMSKWWAHPYGGEYNAEGPTALIAAMRCYVASKLGEEVDIPDELA